MDNSRQNSNTHFLVEIRELIKGQEQALLEEVKPILLGQSVCLDLSQTERIDAAGLAALVSLYCEARKAGHEFAVINPRARVARVLALVGLDRMIMRATPEEMPTGIKPQCTPLSLELVA